MRTRGGKPERFFRPQLFRMNLGPMGVDDETPAFLDVPGPNLRERLRLFERRPDKLLHGTARAHSICKIYAAHGELIKTMMPTRFLQFTAITSSEHNLHFKPFGHDLPIDNVFSLSLFMRLAIAFPSNLQPPSLSRIGYSRDAQSLR